MDRRTFVVSGAGTGIGQAIAMALAGASSDNKLVLVGRNESNLDRTRALLPNPEAHHIVVADIRDATNIRKGFNQLKLETLNVHGVIANSGVGGENEYGPHDRWQEIIETNLTGTYNFVNEARNALLASQSEYKQVVVISSILARLGVPRYSAYCASKAGLLGLVRSWATEWAHSKILVNAICPGWVETEMAVSGLKGMAEASGQPFDVVKKRQLSQVPLEKMSRPEEIAALVAFLVSGTQTSITGQSIDINNGALML